MGVKTATASGQSFATGGSTTANVQTEETREAAFAPAQSAASTAPAARDAASSSSSEDTLLDLDDIEMPRAGAMAEADDFILDLQDAAEARPQEAPPAETFSTGFEIATASAPEVDESIVEAEMLEEMRDAAPQAEQFAEAQVIGEERRGEFAGFEEQPSVASERASYQQDESSFAAVEAEPEMQHAPDTSQMQETSELPSETQFTPTAELVENLSSEATIAQPESASPQAEAAPISESAQATPAGQIGLEQLSPEVIDAIARRVVEQLSTKVVEQIAWEVVPPLAELLIKRRLEEEGKQ